MGIELIKNFTDSILCGQNIILFIKDTISHIITIIDKKEETSLTEKILEVIQKKSLKMKFLQY